MSETVEGTTIAPKFSSTESETIPRLRFPRYSTQWQRIALRELLTEPPSYGLNAPATEHRADLPLYLRITDIDENGRYLRDGRVSVAQAVTSYAYLERGDIAVARTGARFKEAASFAARPMAPLRRILALGNPYKRAKWPARHQRTEYASVTIPLPTGPLALEEQRRIAECLQSLDELIAAEAEKLEALKHHKKGLLQQLFPAEGETTPASAYPDSTEWETSGK